MMHVDRSRFLLLTASLAAAACKPGPASTPDRGETSKRTVDDGGGSGGEGSSTSSGVWLEIEPGTEDPKEAWGNADCNNAVGAPKSCSGLSSPGPHCESFSESQRICAAFPRFMQPRAAEAAIDCMLAMSGTEAICDWNAWQTCANAGLQASCVDPASRQACETISSQCGGSLDVFQCQQAFAATPPASASRVSSCIQEFCEVSFCIVDFGAL